MIIGLIFISIALLAATVFFYKEWCSRKNLKPGEVFIDVIKDPNPFSLNHKCVYVVLETKRNTEKKLWVKYLTMQECNHGSLSSFELEYRYRSFIERKKHIKQDNLHLYFSDSFIEKINETVSNIKAEEK